MATKYDLQQWVEDALRSLGGSGTVVDVAREIWNEHEEELRDSGDLFYTWQYDMCQWPSVSPHWRPRNSPLVAIISPRWWPSDVPTGGHRISPPGLWGRGVRSEDSPLCRRLLGRAGSCLARR
jgi:hypothetical protein